MKSTYITVVVLCFLSSILKAQETMLNTTTIPTYTLPSPYLGIIGGIQTTSFYDEKYGSSNFQVGFNLGLTYCIPISKRFSFEPQLIYSKKGGEMDYSSLAYLYDESVRYRLHYLQLPLELSYQTNGVVDFIIGGYVSYLLDATFNVTDSGGTGYGELNYDQFEKNDFGIIGGIGFNFPISKLSIKYEMGLNDVTKNNSSYKYLTNSKNQGFSLTFTQYF